MRGSQNPRRRRGCAHAPPSKKFLMVVKLLCISIHTARTIKKEIARQLSTYCTAKEIIPQQQFGFRANSSCEVALLHALDGWMRAIDKGDMVGALLVDLSKAFDTVPHQKLIMELADIGCSMSSLAWFASYLSDRYQRVVQPPIITEWMPVTRGAPQGGGLSPRFLIPTLKIYLK